MQLSAYLGFQITANLAAGTYDDGLARAMSDIEHATGGMAGDPLRGSSANNRLIGNAGNDTLLGDSGQDSLFGGADNDRLDGGADRDTLNAGAGEDTLVGGLGDDSLTGGLGSDQLSGGPGSDVFRFASALAAVGEVIADFDAAQGDVLDPSGIDANGTLAGNGVFAFLGGGGFTNAAGQLRFAGGVLAGDVNRDAVADFAITLNGVAALGAASILL